MATTTMNARLTKLRASANTLFLEAVRIVPLTVLLLLLGLGIHGKAYRAVAPPIYDPITYLEKGQRFFSEIHNHHFPNPLEVLPSFRPPGCIPFFFPSGYHGMQSFLFWSMLSPLAVWLLALWVAFRPTAKAATTANDAIPFVLCAGLVSLPMFYHFEINSQVSRWVGQWGLVDTLLAALSALAVSFVVRGVRKRSLPWTTLGLLIAAYTVFIKPSGAIMMACISGIWFVEVLLQRTSAPLASATGRSLGKFVALSAVVGVAIYALAIILCLTSSYLAPANLSFGVGATGILRKLMSGPTYVQVIRAFIHPTLGWYWFVPMVLLFCLGFIVAVRDLIIRRSHSLLVRLLAALLILVAGVHWWLGFAGPEPRYYYPFLLVVIVWLAPGILPRLQAASASVRTAVASMCLWPPLVLTVLLWTDAPSVPLQKAMGVNLSSGGYGDLVAVANTMITEAHASGKITTVYNVQGGMLDDIIWAIDHMQAVKNRRPAAINWFRPVDWVREPGVRYSDLNQSDFIHYGKEGWRNLPSGSKIPDYNTEIGVFGTWLQTLGSTDGVERSESGGTSILKISDRPKLLAAYQQFALQFVWRDEFKQNNPELFPPNSK